jgi:hypothetical protein
MEQYTIRDNEENVYLAFAVSTLGQMLNNGPTLVKNVSFTRNTDGGFSLSIALSEDSDPGEIADALDFLEAL